MRVNVYAEEMTDRVEIIGKQIDGQTFTGLRFYLELPATVDGQQHQGPFMHRPGDDDSSAVTFWGKRDLRLLLALALAKLDEHYGRQYREPPTWLDMALTPSVRRVLRERVRQVCVLGYTSAHDDAHADGELEHAAACYALMAGGTLAVHPLWPAGWGELQAKPTGRMLEVAAALMLAALERHDRARAPQVPGAAGQEVSA